MDAPTTSGWKKDLERLLRSSPGSDAGEVIEEICDLAAAMGDEAGDGLLDAHSDLMAYRPALTRAFQELVVGREIAEATQLLKRDLAGPISFREVAGERSAGAYDRLGEIFDHVEFRGRHRVVMVGCGWRPVTIFRIHDSTAVPEIVGLDVVPEAVETAAALAAKLGYGRMRVELCDGRDYDYGEADIVYVASMVSPKAAVVARIADTAPEGVQIILWEPHSLGRLWAESAERGLDPRLEVTGRGNVQRLTRDVFVRRRGVPASPRRRA